MSEKAPNSVAPPISLSGYDLTPLYHDGIVAFSRAMPPGGEKPVLLAHAASDRSEATAARLLRNEYELRSLLRTSWALVPRQLSRSSNGIFAVYDDDAGGPLGMISETCQPVERALSIAVKASLALKATHESGLIHRSITPFTLFVNDDDACRISNFGFAQRQRRDTGHTQQKIVLRADVLPYISPEHTGRTHHPIDERSDLYSLGVVIYQLLTGQLPFKLGSQAQPTDWIHSHIARAPTSPKAIDASIPEALSAIVLKLLEKTPALRYQSAAGLEADLKRCEVEWGGKGLIGFFQLGDTDQPAELVLAAGLFGRENEMRQLLAALDEVRRRHRTVLVTLTGESGVGKSTLLGTFLDRLQGAGLPIAAGKADQFRIDVPYAPISEAIRRLVHNILGQDEAYVAAWRTRLTSVLGTYGKVACRIAPSLSLLADDYPAPASDVVDDAQVEAAMKRIIDVFSAPDDPFILVIDDYQWIDIASHRLIERLLASSDARPMLVICTARETAAASDSAPLASLRRAAQAAVPVRLSPLDLGSLTRALAETLRESTQHIEPLAKIIQTKTLGNPFFVSQFLRMLADCRLMRVANNGKWQYNLDAIDAYQVTDNVADLVLERLLRLTQEAKQILATMACLGRSTELWLIGELFSLSERALHATLALARSLGVVTLSEDSYSFTHDRVQEAASALLETPHRAGMCLRAGKLLGIPAICGARAAPDDVVFRAAGWLAQGLDGVTHEDAADVARIFLTASQRARLSAALASAEVYVEYGLTLLDRLPSASTVRAELYYALRQEYAATLFQRGRLDAALGIVEAQIAIASTRTHAATASLLKVEIHSRRSENGLALKTAISGLAKFGITLSSHPSAADCDFQYARIRPLLSAPNLEKLHTLDEAGDPEIVVAMQLLASAFVPASFLNEDVAFLSLCEMIRMTAAHGMTAASAPALAWLGVLICHRYGANQEGFRLGETARHIVSRRHYIAWEPRVLLPLDQLSVWTQPLSYAVDCSRTAFTSAIAHGDTTMACYAACHIVANLLVRGDNLLEVKLESARGLSLVRECGFKDVEAILELQQAFIDDLTTADDLACVRLGKDYRSSGGEQLATYEYWQWIYRAYAYFLAGRMGDAALCLDRATAFGWSAPAHIHNFDFHFVRALVVSSQHASADLVAIATLREDAARIRAWAKDNSQTFSDKAALIDAELARIEGDTLAAMNLYDEAATLARERGFWHIAAIAHERAAAHFDSLNIGLAALSHRQFAHEAYIAWGATAKARQLERLHPHLAPREVNKWQLAPGALAFDNESVLRAYHALTEEVRLDQVIKRLMTIVLECAGAQMGYLVRMTDDGPVIEASAITNDHAISIEISHIAAEPDRVPLTLVNTAVRTKQVIRVSEPFEAHPFASDKYFVDKGSCSAICIPLVRQNAVVGALYLENRLMRDGFTVAHTRLLELIAAQAAISLHTARLYDDLHAENDRRQRVEADLRASQATLAMGESVSLTGSWRWNLSDDVFDCSNELLRLFELHDVPAPVRLHHFLARVHPEDRAALRRAIDSGVRKSGTVHSEHRIIRKDESVRYVVVIGKPLHGDETSAVYVGTVTDVTERRLAEDAVRTAQTELARVARATTVGQLTASITHEVNQPLMTITSNAGASLRWLAKSPPNLANVKEGLEEIISAGQRAADMIRSLGDLTRKNKPVLKPIDLNATVHQILTISRAEIDRRNVSLQLELMESLPHTFGDAIQLQQVILNLVLNAIEAMNDVPIDSRRLDIATTRPDAGTIALDVSDSGPGISAEALETVFQPFYTTKENGMGMGLSICRSIIEAHGGRLNAQRRPSGTTFCFTLPLRHEAQ